MKMLRQILTGMYIEPELLAELNEEQKQILFFKMRDEQIQRWRERETQLEKEEAAHVKDKKVSGKTVSWMKGLDDDMWVWVMGEHSDDKPYDQICDEIMAERAAPQAQREAKKLRKVGVRCSQSTSSREHIVRWFKEEQLPLRAGFQRDQSWIAPWFHGIIFREQAEALLNEGEPGYFLVHVSKRIFGYVLSYRSTEGIKHLLIDTSENCYMLLGDQIRFRSLSELVEYHEPLSLSGVEDYLRRACGQKAVAADYTDLFT